MYRLIPADFCVAKRRKSGVDSKMPLEITRFDVKPC